MLLPRARASLTFPCPRFNFSSLRAPTLFRDFRATRHFCHARTGDTPRTPFPDARRAIRDYGTPCTRNAIVFAAFSCISPRLNSIYGMLLFRRARAVATHAIYERDARPCTIIFATPAKRRLAFCSFDFLAEEKATAHIGISKLAKSRT